MNCRKLNIPQRGEDITTDEELDAAFERAKIHEKDQRDDKSGRETNPPVYPTNAPFEMFKGLAQ